MPPLYDPEAVRPMWEELANVGVKPLTTAEEVDELFSTSEGSTLVVINSVCGCAAGGCRPGVSAALQNKVIPDRLVTVFAGVDTEAVARMREYMEGMPPSSPNVVLFKDGELVFMLHRHDIEQMTAVDVANRLIEAFNQNCSAEGPSVPPEVYEQNAGVQQCGSTIPLYPGN